MTIQVFRGTKLSVSSVTKSGLAMRILASCISPWIALGLDGRAAVVWSMHVPVLAAS